MIHRARVVEKTGTARVADAPVGASSGSRRDRLKGEVSPGDASDRGASQNLYPLRQRCRSPGAGFQLPGARSHKNTSNLRWLPPVKSLRNRPRPSASPTPATAPPSNEQRPAVSWKPRGRRASRRPPPPPRRRPVALCSPTAGGCPSQHRTRIASSVGAPSARRGSWQAGAGSTPSPRRCPTPPPRRALLPSPLPPRRVLTP